MAISKAFSQWYEHGNTFLFGDYPVFYRDEGIGDVILCLHGFPTSSWDWSAIWDDLAAQYRVITFDMLGFGYSAKPREHSYSIYEQADLCEQLLRHLSVNRFHILAHDIGDNVSQEILARQLENPQFDIQSICLLNGGMFPEKTRPRLIQRLLLQPVLGTLITYFYNRRIFGKQFSEVFGESTKPSSDALDEFWAGIEHHGGQRIIHKLIRYLPEGMNNRERWVGALKRTAVSSKFIIGMDDPVGGHLIVETLCDLIPDAKVTCLDGIGHYPQIEAPKKTLASYLQFLDS
jgi:pimeloyl-ACP methyl ester carboxylesterase